MIVYGLYYNPCVHESSDGLQGLYMTKNKAEEAMYNFVKEYLESIEENNKWCLENDMTECVRNVSLRNYERVFVEEIEVQE